ncbi:MAG: diguanylate cyclase [Thermoanaerobaculia bacterium]
MTSELDSTVPTFPEALWRSATDTSGDVIFTIDRQSRILFVSETVERVFGYTPELLRGRPLTVLMPERLRARHRAAMFDYVADHRRRLKSWESVPFPGLHRDGHEVALEVSFGEFRVGEEPCFVGVVRDVASRRLAAEAVRDRQEQLRLLVGQMPAVLWSTDLELRITSVQGAALDSAPLQPQEIVGRSLTELFHAEEGPIEAHRRALEGASCDYDVAWGDGVFHCHVEPFRDREGRVVGAIGVGRDITERKLADEKTQRALSLLGAALDSTADGLLVVDLAGRIISHNHKFAEIWGVPEEILAEGDDDRALESVLDQLVEPGAFMARVRELYSDPAAESHDVLEFKDGRVLERYSQPQRLGDSIVGRVWSFRDVTERRRAEERIEHLAYHDALTDLPNRLLVSDRLDMALASARRRQRSVAMLFLDLDHFKRVNDRLGHSGGDQLLRSVADRLSGLLRSTDTVGRLGGDEFIIVLPDLSGPEHALPVAQKILDLFDEPFQLGEGQQVDITTSMGISVYPDDGAEMEELLKRADIAMYRAKELGRDNYQLSTPRMHLRAARTASLMSRLREAVESDELVLHYQPILELGSREVCSVEALVRWRQPSGRLLEPSASSPRPSRASWSPHSGAGSCAPPAGAPACGSWCAPACASPSTSPTGSSATPTSSRGCAKSSTRPGSLPACSSSRSPSRWPSTTSSWPSACSSSCASSASGWMTTSGRARPP